mmetsp:Transcript_10723/g.16115  ORF Transcript_10723/g.16115 Transcript_10723/m.16115 type:complete len:328 (-) Transcript_10723:159-1142(-)
MSSSEGSWQWKDDNEHWNNYSSEINAAMHYCKIGDQLTFNTGGWKYIAIKLSEYAFVQQNRRTKTKRYARLDGVRYHVYPQNELQSCIKTLTKPSWWSQHTIDSSDCKVQLAMGRQVCADIISMVFAASSAVKIQTIYSVQNEFLFALYQAHRTAYNKLLGRNTLNEKYLWHGTDEATAEKICQQGFLRDFNRRSAFGSGVYFSNNIKTALQYAPVNNDGFQCLLLSRVIVGESCVGYQSYKVPPCKPNTLQQYESMVDNVYSPSVFVITKDNQCYPEFMVKFGESSRVHIKHVPRCICGCELKERMATDVYLKGVVCDQCYRSMMY